MTPSGIAVFSVIIASLLLAVTSLKQYERDGLIESAVQQAKKEFARDVEVGPLSSVQKKFRAFKMASPSTLAQARERLKFERIVKLAERGIMEEQRKSFNKDMLAMAEALSSEVLFKPGSVLTEQEIARIFEETECREQIPKPPDCGDLAAQRIRRPDGTCNNLENPTLGAADTPLRRLIPPRYDDGSSRPRGFLQNQRSPIFDMGPFAPPLPSPRIASIGILTDRVLNDSVHSHLLMLWGAFFDHDLDFVPENTGCPPGCEVTDEFEGRCYPIPVTLDDTDVLVTGGDTPCHGFSRSLPACPLVDDETPMFQLPPREQINQINHYIDASMIYSHNEEILLTRQRDTSSGLGLLRVGPPVPGTTRPSLPDAEPSDIPLVVGCPDNPPVPCFITNGDARGNENVGLVVLHTIWLREHNRIATIIGQNNPGFDDEQIFQTTRNIVAAIVQKLLYKDYLPILIGSDNGLIPDYTGYNSNVDPRIPNAFAAAAYRFGHSQIQPIFERLDENYESIPAGPLPLVDAFLETSAYRNDGGTDPLIRGFLSQPARQVDEFINSVITNDLFAGPFGPGLDLASLNLQRSRDHGLPPYLVWKQWASSTCGVSSEFRGGLTEIHLLQTYGNLDTVDLFIGGLAEEPLPGGGIVGAVFACIFANTFRALRDGDRFYYENPNPEDSLFSPEQIAEIEKATLSRVICDNTGVTEIQENAFMVNEPRVPCEQLPSVDLSLWTAAAYQHTKSTHHKESDKELSSLLQKLLKTV